jgi:hypothetical protein
MLTMPRRRRSLRAFGRAVWPRRVLPFGEWRARLPLSTSTRPRDSRAGAPARFCRRCGLGQLPLPRNNDRVQAWAICFAEDLTAIQSRPTWRSQTAPRRARRPGGAGCTKWSMTVFRFPVRKLGERVKGLDPPRHGPQRIAAYRRRGSRPQDDDSRLRARKARRSHASSRGADGCCRAKRQRPRRRRLP